MKHQDETPTKVREKGIRTDHSPNLSSFNTESRTSITKYSRILVSL